MISLSQDQSRQMRRMILIMGTLVTFVFWFPLDDPMNIPKIFVVALCSTWILGTMVVAYFYQRPSSFSRGEWMLFAFVIGLVVSAMVSDVRYTAIMGAAHRNNGVLSYLALAVLALAAMLTFDLKSLHQFRSVLLLVGAISTLYGLLQTTGNDPFKWNLYYNAVIGTLGNPDFFSALVGVCAIATLWFLLSQEDLRWRLSGIVLLVLEIFIVKRSGSFQGLLAFAIGATFLILVKLWQVKRSFGMFALIGTVFAGSFVLIGLFNKGPIASLVYRSSIENRQDYWSAAISMFRAHPIAGVGFERFAENYPIYAPQVQFIQGQPTDNAHNVFLHFLATGGLLLILPYLFLVGVIFWTALKSVKSATGPAQIDVSALFAIWFALLLISLISIDNLGVTVWFWISGGALYAMSRVQPAVAAVSTTRISGEGKSLRKIQMDNSTFLAPVVSSILVLIVLIFMVPVVRTSGTLYQLSGNTGGLTQEQYVVKLKEVSNSFPRNTQTLTSLADLALRTSDTALALEFTQLILKVDPGSQNGNLLRARAFEISQKYASAVSSREKLMKLDPWNTANMLEIVRDYVALQDIPNAKAMAEKITQLRPGGPEDVAAAALLEG